MSAEMRKQCNVGTLGKTLSMNEFNDAAFEVTRMEWIHSSRHAKERSKGDDEHVFGGGFTRE